MITTRITATMIPPQQWYETHMWYLSYGLDALLSSMLAEFEDPMFQNVDLTSAFKPHLFDIERPHTAPISMDVLYGGSDTSSIISGVSSVASLTPNNSPQSATLIAPSPLTPSAVKTPPNHPHKLTHAQRAAILAVRQQQVFPSPSMQPQTNSEFGDDLDSKRQFHIQSEQKRRLVIKNGFDALRAELPGYANKKLSKAVVLSKALEYIQHLKHELDVARAEIHRVHQNHI